MMKLACALLAACILTAACASAPEPAGGRPPELDVVLTPRADTGTVRSIGVQMRIEAPGKAAGEPMLQLPLIYAATPTAAYSPEEINATDGAGSLPLVAVDDPVDPANSIYFRRWSPTRATVGDVTVRFEAPERLFGPRVGVGPPFNLLREEGGFSGSGVVFMIGPVGDAPHRIHLSWDMRQAPKGWRGAWSLGEGSVRTVGPASSVVNAYYMAGPIKSYPPSGKGDLVAYWMREPHFDMTGLAAWVEKAHHAVSVFFRQPNEHYGVFFRVNANSTSGGGGAALVQSFMAGYGEKQNVSVESMRGFLAHEITHSFTHGLEGPNGAVSWYGEGLAEFYSTQLSYRAGLLTADEMLEVINSRSEAYYGNAFNRITNAEVTNGFWRERQIQRLPYGRGWAYFALMDHRIRERSRGARSLDDVILAMNARRASKGGVKADDWVEIIRAELGEQAVEEYRGMEAGDLMAPPDGAFGPCFTRKDAVYDGRPGYRWERIAGTPDSQCNAWGPIKGL